MPFHDLNVAYIPDHAALSNTLLFAKELGYETVALSVAVAGDLPSPPPSIPVSAIMTPNNLEILTRLTLTISETAQNHRLPSLASSYDIIALRPTNEKAFQQCCHNLECDIISIDLSQSLSFQLKFTTISSALQRGIRLEICYSPGVVSGSNARRNLISGATQLIRYARGRGIIVSSEAKSVLGLRAPWDVANLAQVWGLPQQRAKEALCEEMGKVVRLASLKRTSYRGVVDIIDGGSDTVVVAKEKEHRNNKSADRHQADEAKSVTRQVKSEGSGPKPTPGGAKRKASESSLNTTHNALLAEENPLSKSQRKKRAKKARLEGKTMSDSNVNIDKVSKSLPQHKTLKSSGKSK